MTISRACECVFLLARFPSRLGDRCRYAAKDMTESEPDENEHLQWWFWPYWLLCMILSPVIFAVLLVAVLVSIPFDFIRRIKQKRREKDICNRLVSEGRFAKWIDVESRLKDGSGTLIVQHCSPKGPIREWWTDDDIIGDAPISLPGALSEMPAESELEMLQTYARECSQRYLDEETGLAKLTEVPVPRSVAMDPRKYTTVHVGDGFMTAIILPRGRELPTKFPTGNVITLIEWFDEPIMAVGDAESVFLNAA